MAKKLAITFVLPALSETHSLRATVETIVRLAGEHLREVLIVLADRSAGETVATARQLRAEFPRVVRIHQQQLPRLGGAIREAFAAAAGSQVMLMAADGETDPELIPRFIEKMQQGCWDVVAGSRWLSGGGFEGYGRTRLLLNRLFQRLLALLFATRLTDLTYAYRLYRRKPLDGIRWDELGHPFLLECLLKPLRLGARVAEVPCRWRRRSQGSSAGSWAQMFRYVPLALRVRFMRRRRMRVEKKGTGPIRAEHASGRWGKLDLIPFSLWLILAVALGMRLLGAAKANLIFDERAHWALAQTISLQGGQLHLVSRSLDHPLLSIYVLKLSSLLFGSSDFGLRLLHVLAGTLTVAAVYFLGRRVFSEKAGLWAAGLLAVDQFHASWSRVFMPEVLVLLFSSLALLQFLRALEKDRARDFALLGLLLGLACLSKEPAVLLIAALWIYLLVTPEHRRLLRRPRWYLAQGVLLAVVAPDVIWNALLTTESYLYRDAALASGPVQLSLKSFSLYLGEMFQQLIGPHVLDKDYAGGNVYACHWAAGLLYLASIAAAVARRRDPAVRLLLVFFLLVFVVFLVLPGGETFDPFWWASISLIPAVACAGWMLARAAGRERILKLAAAALLVCLGVRYLGPACRQGPYQARPTVREIAADHLRLGRDLLESGNLPEAEGRFIYVLNIGGPDADAYCGLALVAHGRGRFDKARVMLVKCLKLEPRHAEAIELGKKLE